VKTAANQITRWWWVRHAPVTVNNGCVYGQTDPICDCDDDPAFCGLAGLLPRDAVWVTSHFTRTHMTATAIVRAGLPGPEPIPGPGVILEHDLAEQSFGEWHGMKYTDLTAMQAEAYHRFWLAPAHQAPPGGESFIAVMERVSRTIRRLNAEHAGRDIIAVTHGGTIKAALSLALGIPVENALAFLIDNCSITRLDHLGGGTSQARWRVVTVNQRPWLQDGAAARAMQF
jgi:alpha-ribazole phosphatase